MRTTLDIDDDILEAAKEIAARERISTGKVISRLAREGLRRTNAHPTGVVVKNGVPVFPARSGEVVTVEYVERLMGGV